MKLSVLSVAYPFAPVSCNAVGGAEQVLAHLDRAICDAGHHSIVLAGEGSSVRGRLVTLNTVHGEIDDAVRECVYRDYAAAIRRIVRTEDIDLIHFHGLDFDRYLPGRNVSTLVTLHLPLEWYSANAIRGARPNLFFNCVSRSQRARCPAGTEAFVIENGVPIPDTVSVQSRRWAVCLGRICPEKGVHLAMDAAEIAGVPLLIGGKVFPYSAHQRYFKHEIAPRLHRGSGRFLGAVQKSRKESLLAGARCLLVPSLAPETSSLVAMEALACGTPVIAFPSGALADIVEDQRTGFLVNSVAEMAEAITRAAEINPEDCRRAARERFSVSRMTSEYLSFYEQIATTARGVPAVA